MSSPIIEVEHLTKEFRLGQLGGLGQSLRDGVNRLRGRPVKPREMFKALNDVNFSIRLGEVVGIIGHNGAGKSTLLKTLAGISEATHGRVSVNGRVSPLIEVGAGLVSEMTGRENIFLNGSILGMSRRDIRLRFDEIVEFSELDQFIDTPVKRYSSGMMIRLAFAIATAVESEILIVDEVLAVGDLAFQRKCYDRIDSFMKSGEHTLLMVSHNLRQVERLCTRALMFDKGKLVMDGSPKEVCDSFVEANNAKIFSNRAAGVGRFVTSGEVEVINVKVSGADTGKEKVGVNEDILVDIDLKALRQIDDAVFTVAVHTTDMVFIAGASSERDIPVACVEQGMVRLACRLGGFNLTPGIYAIHLAVEAGQLNAPVLRADNVATFQVSSGSGVVSTLSENIGSVRANSVWQLSKE